MIPSLFPSPSGLDMYHSSKPISMLSIFAVEQSFKAQTLIISPLNHMINYMFSFCLSAPTVLSLDVDTFLLISPSESSWVIALLLVTKSVTFDCDTMYPSLCTMFWLCSFHSASLPGGLSSSHGISPAHYSFQHNSIPSPADTTIY